MFIHIVNFIQMASTSNNNNSSDQDRSNSCFQEWMTYQKSALSELLEAQKNTSTTTTTDDNDDNNRTQLNQLLEKNIKQFKDYIEKRTKLAHEDVSPFFAPSWCTSLENYLIWIGGCRPSSFFRLLYALSSAEIESNLNDFLQGISVNKLGLFSATQLTLVNDLHCKTIQKEDTLSKRLASLQEDMADQPIALIAKASREVGEVSDDVNKALDESERAMVSVLEEADKLRMSTLEELIKILTPEQGVDFLAVSKKLNLSLHEWGKKRDHQHGRNLEAKNPQ